MHHRTAGFHFLLLAAVFLCLLTSVKCQLEKYVDAYVIYKTTDCSVTCGIGYKSQLLCLHANVSTAIEITVNVSKGEKPTNCITRFQKCLADWQCGLKTFTVFAGERMTMDCLGNLAWRMPINFALRVSWFYARGVITKDNSLLVKAFPDELNALTLRSIKEEEAGTYCCRVYDNIRIVKEIYWGIRVLPKGIFDLDYESTQSEWESLQNHTITLQLDDDMDLLHSALLSLGVASVFAGIILLSLYCILLRRKSTAV